MNNEFQVPAKPWGEADIKFLMAHVDFLTDDVKEELGIVSRPADETTVAAPELTDEPAVVPEAVTPSEETATETQTETEVVDEVDLASFTITGAIPVLDGEGKETGGYLEIGSIQEVPTELGNSWVEAGLALAVDNSAQTPA
jgi:hypothetical protein